MIKILQMPLGPLQTNCYLLGCEQTMQAAIIDPSWNGRSIAATADDQGWEITHILLTHAHFDHVGGLAELKQVVNVPIYAHPETRAMLQEARQLARLFQMEIPAPPPPDEPLAEGQRLTIGALSVHVLYTPGHAPGHVSFLLPDHGVIFDGDVLFQQGIGRTDLPGGDPDLLLKTIREKLLTLPDETHVLSGHGPATTIGMERRWNPFLQSA
ncbi:MAG: MBL fold metallo-hydrolase [Anaerolineales bacterium]|nr:MBL fold metallo-hydrolase [Anaerolineales bacterium]